MPDSTTPAQAQQTLVDYDIAQNQQRILQFMQQTHDILMHVLEPVSQEMATTLRDASDGDKGWSILEVLCHLRDYDQIFRTRAQRIRNEEYPSLPYSDHEKLAIEGNYNAQDLNAVKAAFSASRQQTIRFFSGLSSDQWARAGVHPERGHFTMLDAALQVGMHDTVHIEQITRILYQNH